ncbi:MAG TPA: CHASE domain-containing protein [Longimicrobiales bacterium]|nr:CHASE domain-containing protein [Longimicrobiales bacterium]
MKRVEKQVAGVPVRGRARIRVHGTPWLVLVASVALTLTAAAVVSRSARERDEGRFRNAMQAANDRIEGRINVYIASLRGGVALFAASDTVTEDEFRRYVDRLDIHNSFPGIQGIGYSTREAYGLPGERDELHAIRYLEPSDARNQAALGFDMYEETTRRLAMRRARDLGEAALSGRVRLVQEIFGDPQPGFLIYLPVYAMGAIPTTVERRRAELVGFIYAPFRANDLFDGIFGSEQFPRVSFTVYDAVTTDSGAVLHSSLHAPGHTPHHTGVSRLEIGGRIWTVIYESQPMFERGSGRFLIPLGTLAGLLFSGWLFWLARRLSHQRHIAEEASYAKSAFLANMSHELRTPLNAISGYVDLMQLGIPDPVSAAQQEYLSRIQRAQQHLLTLINDVLNFAKLEAGRIEFRMAPTRVAVTVSDAMSMLLPSAGPAGIQLESREGPDVWVAGDEEKIRQILLNLMSNAIKFTDAGGRVDVFWKRTDDRVNICVRDTGIGIDNAEHERIFDAFMQADSDLTRERQGTGLGLSISRALARGMSGDLTVASRVGEGSTFTLTLPLAPPPGSATD